MRFFYIFLVFIFTACNTKQGVEISSNTMEFATINKTTKEQVEIIYGKPHRVLKEENKEIWEYDFKETNLNPFKKRINEKTIFEFNEEEILIKKYKIDK